jgi:nucleotide-binding universal stress UspA family protein
MVTDSVREILVATDFSEAADTAVRVAHDFARAFGARLHVFHVSWPDEHGLTQLFADLVTQLGSSVSVVVASQRGDAAEEIVRYAKGHNVGLIVLGTHGRTGVSRVLMGSVAERVIRTAPCPVLTVPPAFVGAQEAPVLPPASHRCVSCNTVSPDLLCEPCRARLRGQAVYAEREGERPPHPKPTP